jgi:hypothetical protein
MKILAFFLLLWVIFALQINADPDPDTGTDPDPKPWIKPWKSREVL